MPPRLARRVKSPRMSRMPTIVSPHMVTRSAFASRFGWLASHLNRSANGPLACFRYPAADHEGAVNFAIPSYRKCHPTTTRRRVIAIIDARENFPSSMWRLLYGPSAGLKARPTPTKIHGQRAWKARPTPDDAIETTRGCCRADPLGPPASAGLEGPPYTCQRRCTCQAALHLELLGSERQRRFRVERFIHLEHRNGALIRHVRGTVERGTSPHGIEEILQVRLVIRIAEHHRHRGLIW